MPTLVYCTTYAPASGVWGRRYRPWLEAILASGLGADQVLMVDDGSEMLPGWADTRLSSGDDVACAPAPGAGPMLHHFSGRLGRQGVYDFPGWHRSFVFGALYAERHGFDRVIHVESDAYVLSPRLRSWFRECPDGWSALWCPKYGFAELALQVAAGQGLRGLFAFARAPYARLAGQIHESLIPLTQIERGFMGDRWGEEDGDVPRDSDYVCQVPSQREPSYYWWRPGRKQAGDRAAPPQGRLDLAFGASGNAGGLVGRGWSGPEESFRWMVGQASTLSLPALGHPGRHVLRMTAGPHVNGDLLRSQRLVVILNERKLAEFDLEGAQRIGCEVPAGALKRDGTDRLRFLHIDAASPHGLDAAHGDTRRLAVSLSTLSLIPC